MNGKIELIATLSKAKRIVYANSGSIYFKLRIGRQRCKIRLANHPQMRFQASDPVILNLRWSDSEEDIKQKIMEVLHG